jgi:sortase (surface protein transpeptidase)
MSPGVRVFILIVLMIGVFFGGYYLLFHPIPVKETAQEEIVTTPAKTSSSKVGTTSTPKKSTKSVTPSTQKFATTTNGAKIKSYVANLANSQKSKVVKQNPANYLIISKIGVSAPLENVNFDSSGNMASPSGPKVVALYSQGAKIGSPGNAVISGHRDTEKGKAIFYNLSKLVVGDSILITDSGGKGYKYVVDSKNNYPKDSFPSKEIFSNGTSARLNLITCSGTYDRNTKSYPERLVVSAVLAK